MSTSFVYHAFGLHGYDYVSQKFERGKIIMKIRPKARLIRCPVCNSQRVIRRGVFLRQLRSVPIGNKPVWIHVDVPRLQCCECNCTRRINLVIADARRSYTRAFARYVIDLAKVMTLLDVSKFLRIGWDCVKEILKNHLRKRFSNPKLRHVRYLAIDEIYVGKRQKYLTIVMDQERGVIIFVGDGKGADALKEFWSRLSRSRAKILAVATDMGQAYISAVLDHLPGVPLVFDPFHVVKLMNEALTNIRRDLHRELQDVMHKDVLKGTRWILLKNPENLSSERNEYARLHEALKLNEPLATAYYMKEELRQFWRQSDKRTTEIAINSWVSRALSSGIRDLIRVGKTVASLRYGILNWYDHPISSGRMEGTNNKIKVLKRSAYGYRDMEFFKLRILAIHEAKYALTG